MSKQAMKLSEKTKPILAQLSEMAINDVLTFPAEKLGSVKTMCSEYGFQWGKKFSTSVNRQERTFNVTRIA